MKTAALAVQSLSSATCRAKVISQAAGRWLVRLESAAGCQVCHHGLCFTGERDEKEMWVTTTEALHPGDTVLVHVAPSTARVAIGVLYGLPALLVVFTLLVLLALHVNDGVAGLSALLILAPYYLVVRHFSTRLASRCHVTIHPL